MIAVKLPFPPASLSGHATGHWRVRGQLTAKHRQWALWATQEALRGIPRPIGFPGDIPIHIRFEPPNRRGDRTNFANRMKPALDGIADALGVNDSRFLPSYEFSAPKKPGAVYITINPEA